MWSLKDIKGKYGPDTYLVKANEGLGKKIFKLMLAESRNAEVIALENDLLEDPIEYYYEIVSEGLIASQDMIEKYHKTKNQNIVNAIAGKIIAECAKKKINPDNQYIKDWVMACIS